MVGVEPFATLKYSLLSIFVLGRDRTIPNAVELNTYSGTHYEIGVEQGRSIRDILRRGMQMLPSVMGARDIKPQWMPMPLFLSLARRRAMKTLREDMTRYYPRQTQRLEGIAEGAEISPSWAFLFQSMELMITFGSNMVHVPACTSIGLLQNRTATKETLVAKNFDYPNDLLSYHLTCLSRSEEGYQTLGCTMAPLPGMLDGMNEHGLTMTYNLAFSTEEPQFMAPLSLALQEMLETCKTTEEAVNYITRAKHAGNGLITLADAEGGLRTVELSHQHSAIREPIDGMQINTNHYLTEGMKKYEIPHEAAFTKRAPKQWDGKRFHGSSDERLKRGLALLGKESMDERTVISILRDHGEDNQPSNYTICQHGDYSGTLRSCIFYPERRTLKVLYGNPCQNEFSTFSFS